jgi:hypothetical protein
MIKLKKLSNLKWFFQIKQGLNLKKKKKKKFKGLCFIAKKPSWNDELTPIKMLWEFSFRSSRVIALKKKKSRKPTIPLGVVSFKKNL